MVAMEAKHSATYAVSPFRVIFYGLLLRSCLGVFPLVYHCKELMSIQRRHTVLKPHLLTMVFFLGFHVLFHQCRFTLTTISLFCEDTFLHLLISSSAPGKSKNKRDRSSSVRAAPMTTGA